MKLKESKARGMVIHAEESSNGKPKRNGSKTRERETKEEPLKDEENFPKF